MSNYISGYYIRKVKPEDIDLLYKWANDPITRNNAFNTDPISYENHIKWFNKTLIDANRIQLIFVHDEVPVGQFRIDIENRIGMIDYSIAPEFRGRGYGSVMCGQAINYIKSTGKVDRLIAQVKTENTASKKCFINSGFKNIFEQFEIEFSNENIKT